MTETKKSLSSRQNLRKWLLVISFVLLPVTLMFISPIVIMMGAAQGIATGSMLLFIANFFLSLFVARLWCGWLCPMGAWQEICSPVMKHTVQEGWRNYVKYGVTVLWLAVLAYLFFSAGGSVQLIPSSGWKTASRSRPLPPSWWSWSSSRCYSSSRTSWAGVASATFSAR